MKSYLNFHIPKRIYECLCCYYIVYVRRSFNLFELIIFLVIVLYATRHNKQKKYICDLKIILRLTHLEIKYRVFPKTKNKNHHQNTTSLYIIYNKLISSDPAQNSTRMVYKKIYTQNKNKFKNKHTVTILR